MSLLVRLRLTPRGLDRLGLLAAVGSALIIRAIPQLLFPYPIGFDTSLYLGFAKAHAMNPDPFRIFEQILAIPYLAGANMLVVMEIAPIIVYGVLALGIYIFARNALKWSVSMSFFVSLYLSLSLSALRMSWDMHDLVFGLALLLLTLSFVGKVGGMRPRYQAAFVILSLVTMLSHELVALALLGVLATEAFLTTSKTEKRIYGGLVALGLGAFLGVWYIGDLGKVFDWVYPIFQGSAFFEPRPLGGTLVFLIQVYSISIPFALFGFFRQRALLVMLAFFLLGSFAPLLTPTFLLGGIPQWRYMLLLVVPVSFYVVNGVKRIFRGRLSSLMIVGILLLNSGSLSFIGAAGAPPYYQVTGEVPPSMVQTSAPLADIPSMIQLLQQVPSAPNTTLLIYGDWLGWANYFSNAKVVGFGGEYNVNATLAGALGTIPNKQNLWLLWWDAQQAESLRFTEVGFRGSLFLFHYSGGLN